MRKILFLIAAFAILVIVAVAGPPGYQVCTVDQQVELIGIADVPFMQPADIAYSSPEVGTDVIYSYAMVSVSPGFDVPVTGSAGGVAYTWLNERDNLKNAPILTDYVYIGNQLTDNSDEINAVPTWLFTCNLKFPLLL